MQAHVLTYRNCIKYLDMDKYISRVDELVIEMRNPFVDRLVKQLCCIQLRGSFRQFGHDLGG